MRSRAWAAGAQRSERAARPRANASSLEVAAMMCFLQGVSAFGKLAAAGPNGNPRSDVQGV